MTVLFSTSVLFGASMDSQWIFLFIVMMLSGFRVKAEINLSQSRCYKPNPSNYRRSLRIVGGRDAAEGETPYMVALMKNGVVVCGGTIISEKFLLLAAHCLCNNQNAVIKPTQLKLFLGARKISDVELLDNNHLDEQTKRISEVFIQNIIMHPEYMCGRDKRNDIALLQLKKPIQFNEFIQPVCLPKETSLTVLDIGRVTGWGYNHEDFNVGTKPNVLQSADVPVWENDDCQTSYRSVYGKLKISDGQMCAGGRDGGLDSCWMDSGGPLVSRSNGNLIGIVSTGFGCARKGLPGIYTRLSKYTNWIMREVNSSSR